MAAEGYIEFKVRINWRGRVALATLHAASMAFRLRLDRIGEMLLDRGLNVIERRDDWFDVELPPKLKV